MYTCARAHSLCLVLVAHAGARHEAAMGGNASRAIKLAKRANSAAPGSAESRDAMTKLARLITSSNATALVRLVIRAVPGLPRTCVEAACMDDCDTSLAALVLIGDLALAQGGELLLFETEGLVSALVRAAGSGATTKIKEAALMGLHSISAQEGRIEQPLFEFPGLVSALVNALGSGETEAIRESAVCAIRNLAAADSLVEPLCNVNGLLPALATAAHTGATDDIKENAILVLCAFSVCDGLENELVETPHVLAALAQASAHGATDDLRCQAIMALGNIAEAPEAEEAVCKEPGLIQTLCDAAKQSKKASLHEAALFAMANVASNETHGVAVAQMPGFMDALLVSARTCQSNECKEMALLGLCNAAIPQSNKSMLFNMPHVMDTLVRAAREGKSNAIRENALRALSNMAECSDLPLAATPFLVDAAVRSCGANDDAVRLYAVTTLCNISRYDAAAINKPEVFNVVLAACENEDEATELRQSAAMAVANLAAADDQRRNTFQMRADVLQGMVAILSDLLDSVRADFHLAEPLQALASLACVQENRAVLANTELSALLVRALGDALAEDDVSACKFALKAMEALGVRSDDSLKARLQDAASRSGDPWAEVREAALRQATAG